MTFTLDAAANHICHRLTREHVHEGASRPVVTWTGRHELRNDRLWIEVKVIEPDHNTSMTGWTDGEEKQGFITFRPND